MKKDYMNMGSKDLFRCVLHDIEIGNLIPDENLQLAIDYAKDLELELEILRGKTSYIKQVVADTLENES